MAFTSNSSIRISSRFTDDDNVGPGVQAVDTTYGISLSNGTGAGQADRQYANTETIADGATFDIDLGTVEDVFGNALGAANVTMIVIRSSDANTTSLTIGGSSADYVGLPDQTVSPGGVALVASTGAAGLGAVADGSSDTVRIVNGGGAAATVDIYIAARSA